MSNVNPRQMMAALVVSAALAALGSAPAGAENLPKSTIAMLDSL